MKKLLSLSAITLSVLALLLLPLKKSMFTLIANRF